MRLQQLDEITQLELGTSITAVKALTLSEEYLRDHFPRFPVMPGVLMLEAMFQASMWLIHATNDFSHSIITLKEARNVKYADFVAPGDTLTISASILKKQENVTTLKAQGVLRGEVAVNARLLLAENTVNDRWPTRPNADDYTRRKLRQTFKLLYPEQVPAN